MAEPDLKEAENFKTVDEAIAELDGDTAQQSGPGVGDSPGPESPTPEIPTATGEDVIALLEMGLTGSFAAICGLQRIPWDATISQMATLAEPEKAALRPYAGYVAPYIPKMMQHQDKLGLLFFGLIAFKTVRGKFGMLKTYIESNTSPDLFDDPENNEKSAD